MPEFDPSRLFPSGAAPDYVIAVMREYMDVTLEPVSLSVKQSSLDNPILLSVVRNENERLPDFFRHYRKAGIKHFVFLDNGSTDGTADYLAEQRDVDLYRCTRPFDWMKKHGWISVLIAMYGRDRWYLFADGDEHIVYEGIERGRTFGDVARIMEAKGLNRVRGFLVDMYSDGPLLKSKYKRGQKLLDAYPFFDSTGYKEEKYREIMSRKGGPRQRAFSAADKNFRPEMTKYPMFRLTGRDVFANPHHVWPYEGNFASECYFGILHFKFLPDVLDRIQQAIVEGNYWGGSMEYKCYHAVLSETPDLSLKTDISSRYETEESLRRLKLTAALG